MFQVGDISIALLSDGVIKVDGGGPFGLVPRKLWSRYIKPDEDNMVPMNLTCLLVKADGKNIVVDTGLGSKLDEKMMRNWNLSHPYGNLISNLARHGLQPQDIDIVINTHLHADHCTGNTYFSSDLTPLPTFPKAVYYTQRREYEDALHPNERTRSTYYSVNYEPLYKSGKLQLLEGDAEIVTGVLGVVTPGHTPAHMSVVFVSQDQHALFLCDMASFMVHFEKLAWMTAYDVEPIVTLETKRYWQKWAIERNALLLSAHDTVMPAARLVYGDQEQPRLMPVPTDFD